MAFRPAGIKGRQRDEVVDRAANYRQWRWQLGDALYVNDIDQLEWRIVDGRFVPVALLELTRVDGHVGIIRLGYLAAILKRMCERDPQGAVALEVARALGVCAYVVAWRWDLSEFWVHNLSTPRGWLRFDQIGYRNWLGGLHGCGQRRPSD